MQHYCIIYMQHFSAANPHNTITWNEEYLMEVHVVVQHNISLYKGSQLHLSTVSRHHYFEIMDSKQTHYLNVEILHFFTHISKNYVGSA